MFGCNYVVGDHGRVKDSFWAEMDDLNKHLVLVHGIGQPKDNIILEIRWEEKRQRDVTEYVKSMLREQGAVFAKDEEEDKNKDVQEMPEE